MQCESCQEREAAVDLTVVSGDGKRRQRLCAQGARRESGGRGKGPSKPPAKKVVKKCGGSALLANVPLLEQIVRAVVAAAGDHPVSAKFRTGWDDRCQANSLRNASAILPSRIVTRRSWQQ